MRYNTPSGVVWITPSTRFYSLHHRLGIFFAARGCSMSTLAQSKSKACKVGAAIAVDSANRDAAIDEWFAELASQDSSRTATKLTPQPLPSLPKALVRPESLVAYQPAPRRGKPSIPVDPPDWTNRLLLALCLGFTLFSGVLYYRSLPESPRHSSASLLSVAASRQNPQRFQTIEQVRVGERAVGRNPIREQAELSEPDPATWRQVSLFMKKKSGLGLWIKLLRPQTWIDEHQAAVGSTIFINLAEMGAVGEAQVNEIGPCPAIEPGTGPVVTGTFQHQADARTRLVRLVLEDQPESTGVTDNHPYWSVDRQEFIPVGQLRIGEQVDTEQGPKRVVSITPVPYSGFLYNLETTEHVFRIGSLGTLVHNSCLGNNLKKAGSYGDLGTDAHHIVAFSHRGAKASQDILTKHGIDLNDAMNGVWLPRNSSASRARGALHHEAGSALTNADYLNEVNRRILAADAAGGKSHVLRELQKIRHDLLNGTFPGVRPNF